MNLLHEILSVFSRPPGLSKIGVLSALRRLTPVTRLFSDTKGGTYGGMWDATLAG